MLIQLSVSVKQEIKNLEYLRLTKMIYFTPTLNNEGTMKFLIV
jgi:hypothetical protein